jgi:Protein of unknown function (DUF4235)
MAKFLYRPLAILFSIGGAMLAGTIFKQVWKFVSGEEEAPKARESEYGWREVLAAAAAQGAVFGVVKAAIDRGGLEGFRKLTGVWAGD